MIKLKTYAWITALVLVIATISFWLMFHTFSYDNVNKQLLISSKIYSDFASHIPHIRSFSYGNNWPPQLPIFPGEKTRYHYLFFAVVGYLERIGLPINLALNIPSALGFLALSLLIFITGSKLFSSLKVGLLSTIFFLFNGSFSFVSFFNKHPLSSNSVKEIISNVAFPSFGPWDGGPIAAFWNLNIYTNQRHLGLSFAIAMLAIYILTTKKSQLIHLTGFLIGSLLLINQAAFIIASAYCLWIFTTDSSKRQNILFSLFGIVPWVLIMADTINASPTIKLNPFFLMPKPINIFNFIKYWVLNFGIHFFLIPIGMIFSPRSAKKIIVPTLLLFIAPNVWQFSPDMINNHKLLNFYTIIGSMFSAGFLVHVWKFNPLAKLVAVIISTFLILGGVIDLFPIKNDYYIKLNDIGNNQQADFYLIHTSPSDIVLNSHWLYHPASLAGRSIYNGYSYFTWSYGYDQTTREIFTKMIYQSESKSQACSLLKITDINHVQLGKYHETFIHPNWKMWLSEFKPEFSDPGLGEYVYSVKENCP